MLLTSKQMVDIMETMRQRTIAEKHDISESSVSYIKAGTRYTRSARLAMDIARLTGKKPIEYINPKSRAVYLLAYPELNRKMKG